LFPLFFHLLRGVDAMDVVAHRVLWSFFLTGAIVAVRAGLGRGTPPSFDRRTIFVHLVSALLISVNWLAYVWGVGHGRVVECSLGYFVNPLVTIALGVLFLRERLRVGRWIALALAAFAVAWLSWSTGVVPWLSLVLAFSFGLYGFAKKTAGLRPLDGLWLETALLAPIALLWIAHLVPSGREAFLAGGEGIRFLLVLTGIVTTVPLILFAAAAAGTRLSTLGFLQYLTPTLQFLIGVLVFGEVFDGKRLIGFTMVWIALALVVAEGVWNGRKSGNS
jgi:chloramphenicol-sensitive protein RarD